MAPTNRMAEMPGRNQARSTLTKVVAATPATRITVLSDRSTASPWSARRAPPAASAVPRMPKATATIRALEWATPSAIEAGAPADSPTSPSGVSRTTTVPASLSCHPCLRGSSAIQASPSSSSAAEITMPTQRTMAAASPTGAPSTPTTRSPKRRIPSVAPPPRYDQQVVRYTNPTAVSSVGSHVCVGARPNPMRDAMATRAPITSPSTTKASRRIPKPP